ncbi:MAG: HAMP domain-containing protein [Filimonas sp.]|nr:HAMP domain-containing protein [Filimonas sp.]
MNLKLKFALLFSLIVTAILISSVSVIYYLYANTRTEDYNKRLWAEAVQNYQLFYGIQDLDVKTLHEIDRYSPGNLIEVNTVIIDKTYHVVFANPESLQYKIDYNLINTIRSKGEYYFSQDDREVVGIYFPDERHECFVITSANDRYGKRRLERLQLISGFVVLGAFVLTCIAALIFVKQITKPLTRLGNQMQRINENNLTERVKISSGSEELVQIASNFNDMLKRLEAGFEFQKSFVHHASHELRTPLANMLAQTEAALRRDITVEDAKDVLLSLREDQQELIE